MNREHWVQRRAQLPLFLPAIPLESSTYAALRRTRKHKSTRQICHARRRISNTHHRPIISSHENKLIGSRNSIYTAAILCTTYKLRSAVYNLYTCKYQWRQPFPLCTCACCFWLFFSAAPPSAHPWRAHRPRHHPAGSYIPVKYLNYVVSEKRHYMYSIMLIFRVTTLALNAYIKNKFSYIMCTTAHTPIYPRAHSELV
jgi:hypothetical protein